MYISISKLNSTFGTIGKATGDKNDCESGLQKI